jgi:hypothetical protein
MLGTLVADLRIAPLLHLPLRRPEVALDSVHSYGNGVDQVETLAVLGQDRRDTHPEEFSFIPHSCVAHQAWLEAVW